MLRSSIGGLIGRVGLPLVVGGALFVVAAFVAPALTCGNGVPQVVELTYLETISNWGPKDATGTLEFSFSEGYLSLDVEGLPRLAGQAYEGWLVRSATNEAVSTGQFNTSSEGSTQYEATLPTISDYTLDLFVITVEALEAPDHTPSQQRSIAGFFAVIQGDEDGVRAETGSGLAPTGEPGSGGGAEGTTGTDSGAVGQGSDPRATSDNELPSTLPETGDPTGFLGSVRGMALILIGGLAIVWATVRTRSRLRKGERT